MAVATYEKLVCLEEELYEFDKGILKISMSPENIKILNENIKKGNLKEIEIPIPYDNETRIFTKDEITKICGLKGDNCAYGIELFPESYYESPLIIRLSSLLD